MITANGLIQLGFTPEVDFKLQDDSDGNGVYIKEWNSASPQPSVADIEAADTIWQTEYDSQEYARDRAPEYPSTGDQLDDLFHKGAFSTEMAATLQAVKDKYPKP